MLNQKIKDCWKATNVWVGVKLPNEEDDEHDPLSI